MNPRRNTRQNRLALIGLRSFHVLTEGKASQGRKLQALLVGCLLNGFFEILADSEPQNFALTGGTVFVTHTVLWSLNDLRLMLQ